MWSTIRAGTLNAELFLEFRCRRIMSIFWHETWCDAYRIHCPKIYLKELSEKRPELGEKKKKENLWTKICWATLEHEHILKNWFYFHDSLNIQWLVRRKYVMPAFNRRSLLRIEYARRFFLCSSCVGRKWSYCVQYMSIYFSLQLLWPRAWRTGTHQLTI